MTFPIYGKITMRIVMIFMVTTIRKLDRNILLDDIYIYTMLSTSIVVMTIDVTIISIITLHTHNSK